jgi:mono/diheme cytochrome c family protein
MTGQFLPYWGRIFGAVALICFWTTQPSSSAESEGEPALVAGKLEFQENCAICHGINGKGHGPITPMLKKTPADLTQLSKKNGGEFPFWTTYRMIDGREPIEGHGGRDMPIWGDRFKAEAPHSQGAESIVRGRILELIVYLQSIQEK